MKPQPRPRVEAGGLGGLDNSLYTMIDTKRELQCFACQDWGLYLKFFLGRTLCISILLDQSCLQCVERNFPMHPFSCSKIQIQHSLSETGK